MSSKKLTVTDRYQIAKKVIEHRFGQERAKLRERCFAIAEEIYNATYDEQTRKLMEQLPDGFLPTSDSISFFKDGVRGCYSMPLVDSRRCSEVSRYGNRDYSVTLKGALLRKHEAHQQAQNTVEEAIKLAERELSSALAVFTTIKHLKEGWPELAPFLPAEPTPASRKLPVPQISKLNKTFKLPVKKRAAQAPASTELAA